MRMEDNKTMNDDRTQICPHVFGSYVFEMTGKDGELMFQKCSHTAECKDKDECKDKKLLKASESANYVLMLCCGLNAKEPPKPPNATDFDNLNMTINKGFGDHFCEKSCPCDLNISQCRECLNKF